MSSTFEVGVGFPNPTFLDTLSFTLDAPVEGSFALLKRGLTGTFHSVSEAHIQRYIARIERERHELS